MFDPKKKHNQRELMELAVRLAEKSVFENDGRPHPMVGAVIARDGYVLQTGFRGEKAPGAHAEETALAKLTTAQAVGTRCPHDGPSARKLLLVNVVIGRAKPKENHEPMSTPACLMGHMSGEV